MMGIDRKKGLELPLIPGQIGQRVQKNAQAVLEEHPDEMERVYRLIQFIFDTRLKEGLLGLEGELESTAPPLPRLMERCAGRSEGPARELFASCAQGLERLDREELSALWRRLVEERTELGPEGQAVLAPLGEVLGRYEADRQREALSTARRRLEEMADRVERDYRRRGRVYEALGLSGGAFLVILLL